MATSASYRSSPDDGRDSSMSGPAAGDDESWAFLNMSDGSNTDSFGILTSPESSLVSFGLSVGQHGHLPPSPLAPPSPFELNGEHAAASHQAVPGSLPPHGSSFNGVDLSRVTSYPIDFDPGAESGHVYSMGQEQVATTSVAGSFSDQASAFGLTTDHSDVSLFDNLTTQHQLQGAQFQGSSDFTFEPLQLTDFSLPLSTDFNSTGISDFSQPLNAAQLDFLQQVQSMNSATAWQPTTQAQGHDMFLPEETFTVSSSPAPVSSSSVSQHSVSPGPSNVKLESASSKSASPADPVRKVRGSGARVEKKRKTSPDLPPGPAAGYGQFVIVTPNSITANSGKHNPYECFEAMRSSHKGRKGPLPSKTKENALQVRRKGACFCCHARKVKCDAERPCRNCSKLAVQVPQVVCWQFPDFLDVLFPTLIRSHLGKEAVTSFLTENIQSFKVQGQEVPCSIELFSGLRFSSVFKIKAKFFTAKTQEPLGHWHMTIGSNGTNLQSQMAVPIGLETESTSQRDVLKKTTKDYVHFIIQESQYAEQTTDTLRSTRLPEKVLRIVQKYYKETEAPMVKRALSIYAMHYILTRHLCLTHQTVKSLEHTGLVPQNLPFLTPRVLNRQIKAVIDDLLTREMQMLYESFSKSLKPKSKKEWSQCLAAFLVLCVFMEAIEAAVDTFVISQNEVDMRNGVLTTYKRSEALNLNAGIENMPFKQFAYQFHQIYQTHSKDATTKPFNPLMDDDVLVHEDLDQPAKEMVVALQELMRGESWAELDYLSMDPILPNMEDYPFPRDITENYNGRLLSKFLLSFTNERYIFG